MRWWSLANLVSNAGTWMQLTVQSLLVLQVTGSAAMTGLSLAVQAGPGLLLGLLGGAAVDAWPRKLTAAVSQVALGAVGFTTAALVALDLLNVPTLLALAAVTGIISTVDGPACALLGNDLVPRRDVPSAIALGSAVHSIGRLAGTALAGGAVLLFGTASAFVANGFSFVFVAAVIPFLKLVDRSAEEPEPVPVPHAQPAAGPPAEEPAGPRPGGGARDGLRFFLRRPQLVLLAAITALSSVFGRNYTLTLAVLVTGPLAGGAGSFGTVSTALAVGGIAGALLAGVLQRPSVRLVAAMSAIGAAFQIAAGLSPTLGLLVLLVIPMAIVESISDTAGTTVLQTDPPPAMRGRVLGVWRSLSTGWGLVGPPAIGLLMEWTGPRAALVTGGLLVALPAAAGLAVHARRTRRAATGAVERTQPVAAPEPVEPVEPGAPVEPVRVPVPGQLSGQGDRVPAAAVPLG
ncbi:MFS transporter [Streptomyces sp. NPDC059853]|uniref:MFS transporter n=1 Tax=Streptomyces sp. NPDC059853 TaxID=3346973 RepID=UPI003667A8B2